LDCGEARFTALGRRVDFLTNTYPISKEYEIRQCLEKAWHRGKNGEPVKAAMARRSPKRFGAACRFPNKRLSHLKRVRDQAMPGESLALREKWRASQSGDGSPQSKAFWGGVSIP
jgi:hypothetical protein